MGPRVVLKRKEKKENLCILQRANSKPVPYWLYLLV